jgi:peptidoglycan/LPS O-acetylase OafA/YrhL
MTGHPTTTSREIRVIRSFEGLRGIAAVLVLFYHLEVGAQYFGIVRNSYLAVDLFFVLSGYVIAQNYAVRLTDTTQVAAFTIRRFGRLWPLHIATSLFWFLGVNALQAAKLLADHLHSGLPHNPVRFVIPTTAELLATITMTQGLNLFDYLFGTVVSWTISDEFFIYLLFGAVCLLVRGTPRLLAFALMVACAYAFAIYIDIAHMHCTANAKCFALTSQYGWLRCITGFFLGALLFLLRERPLLVSLAAHPLAQVSATIASLLLFAYADAVPELAFSAPLVFAFLVATLCHDRGPVARTLGRWPFQRLGQLSYSIYLLQGCTLPFAALGVRDTHSGVIHCAVLAAFVGVTIFLARYTYRYIEVPFRKRFNALSRLAVAAPTSSDTALPAGRE